MVKKSPADNASPFDAAANLFDSALAGTVRDSAQQIWLAGLGAFAKAQEEGGKAFDALVNEGATLQRKTQTVAEEKLDAVSAQVAARMAEVGQKVEAVSAKASGSWDRLETIFEQRVAKALTQLGVPQAHEIRELTARIEQLSAQIDRLARAPARPPRKTPPVRAAAKPSAPTPKARSPKRP